MMQEVKITNFQLRYYSQEKDYTVGAAIPSFAPELSSRFHYSRQVRVGKHCSNFLPSQSVINLLREHFQLIPTNNLDPNHKTTRLQSD